jgi:perosamine synthetase
MGKRMRQGAMEGTSAPSSSSRPKPGTLAVLGGDPAVPSPLQGFLPMEEDAVTAVVEALRSVPLSTMFGGFEVGRFEREFARRFKSRNAVAVSSGTSALYSSLVAAGIGQGDEVIVTPLSFVASVSVVVEVGAVPIYADIDPTTFALNPESVRQKMSERTRAILPVHYLGYPADALAIMKMAESNNAIVIEDCAQAHGATLADRIVGTIGHFGCFSFNVGKIMRTGEGGMILTSNDAWDERLREIRVNGLSPGRGMYSFGINCTMPQPIAALGRFELRRLDELLERRRILGEMLEEGVADLPLILRARNAGRVHYCTPFILPKELAPLTDTIMNALRAENVPAFVPCPRPLYELEYLKKISPDTRCEAAEDICKRYFVIDPSPVYPTSTMEMIIAGVRKVFARLDDVRADL